MRLLSALCVTLVWLALLASETRAQQSGTFGPFELHYSVVNTTFLDPKVAVTYGIIRGEKRAILNLAVRENLSNGSEPRTMQLKGRTWDLIQSQALEFREIREGEAVYYIAQFSFINEEWRHFEIDFRPAGAEQTYTFKFTRQLYIN